MIRSLLALAMAVALAAPPALAQGYPPYQPDPGYDGYDEPAPSTGVRIGVGVGPYIYFGPDVLAGTSLRDNVIATNVGVTAEVTVPFTSQFYGRLLGGALNIGADDSRTDVTGTTGGAPDARYNPFLTSLTWLAEGNLMFYFTPPATSAVSPYIFTGVSGLFATGDAAPGVGRSALAIPVGFGIEARVARNLSLFAEGSYRFGLTEVATTLPATLLATANMGPTDCSENPDLPECKPPTCEEKPDDPDCKPAQCHDDPTLPGCPPVPCSENPNQPGCVGSDGDARDRTRFNSGLVLAGLRLGFNPAPRAYVPPPYIPPTPEPEPEPLPEPLPVRPVCDLVELNTLYFDYGSTALTPRARALLNENVELLLENPECCIFVDSYTDHSERDEFGIPLGRRRAQAVYDYYLSRGVSASRMQIRARGVAEPNCDKEDPGRGCERNRRVESLPLDCERFQMMLTDPSYGN